MKLLAFLISLLLCLSMAWHFRIGINITPSLARGLYMVSDTQKLKHGDIVKLCLSEELTQKTNAELYVGYGICSNGLKPLLKFVVGLEGDVVTVNDKQIFVKTQNKPVAITMHIKKRDSVGEKINTIIQEGIIPEGRAFVYSYHDGSFDSRYFGLVDTQTLVRMEELLTF